MKDIMPCQHTLSDDAIYKEVVVIGNGPSGLVTSFMLAGNVPYLKHIPDDLPIDDMLRARLSNIPKGQSLYETDLFELAEGLEGRSQNPIPILMDNLLRPCTDLGYDADSLIEWKYDAEKQIDHVVLGRGSVGGAWPTFPRAVRTLSPARWLALPPHAALTAAGRPLARAQQPAHRLPASAVANYCRRYVHDCKLQRFFRSGVVVSSVTLAPCADPCPHAACPRSAVYCVAGYDESQRRAFRVLCRRVVLAAGGGARPNTLPPLQHVALHTLAHADRAIRLLAENSARYGDASCLVVGSGVSAADVVRAARGAGVRARHVHAAPAAALHALSADSHADLAEVYEMMMDGTPGKYPYYESYPSHVVTGVTLPQDSDPLAPKTVRLLDVTTNQYSDVIVNVIIVLIGSKPDLFFLQTNFNLNNEEIQDKCKCAKDAKRTKRKNQENEEQNRCFFRNNWTYLKSVLDSCKSKYGNSEIKGEDITKLKLEKRDKYEDFTCEIVPYPDRLESKVSCTCQLSNPYSNGIGFGLDPTKPVDGRLNPIAVDKSSHEVLNSPGGLYALGPLTADNFVRFIPGGALAIVSHMHKEKKTSIE